MVDSRKRKLMAAIPVYLVSSPQVPLGYQQIVIYVGQATTLTMPAGTVMALIRPEGGGFRYCSDGQNPTASFGMPIEDGEPYNYDARMTQFKVCPRDTDSLTLNIDCYGEG